MSEEMKALSKDRALEIAARPNGFRVHIYKWSHEKKRRQLNRYKREGLVTREVFGDYFIFRRVKK